MFVNEVGIRAATAIELYHHVERQSRQGLLGRELIEMAQSLNESWVNLGHSVSPIQSQPA